MAVPNVQFPPTNWPGGRYSFLLAALLVMFAVDPLLRNSVLTRTIFDILTVLVFASGALAIGNRRTAWVIAALMIAPELVGIVGGWVFDTQGSLGGGFGGTLRAVVAIIFCIYMAGHILWDVLQPEQVSSDTICAAMCVYLLLGLLWTFVYLLIAHYVPDSFIANDELVAIATADEASDAFSILTYFSFVTLTTLGFGDITPVSPLARTACWLEAVTGQLFLATFVAGLVGIHIANRKGQA